MSERARRWRHGPAYFAPAPIPDDLPQSLGIDEMILSHPEFCLRYG